MSDRKKPGMAYWATVVVVVTVFYVLSIGPALWLSHHGLIPDSANPAITLFYAPLNWIVMIPGVNHALF